jgi:hypothetical protein
MKRSTVLIGIGVIILGISVLSGLYFMDSESIEKTMKSVPIIEPESQKQEKSVFNNIKCSPNALGGIRCLP